MIAKQIHTKLHKIFDNTPTVKINAADKLVIFSDLHMGNGGSRDDFLPNADLFKYVLKHYYLAGNYQLILNGDIEELQRFAPADIAKRWREIFQLFESFRCNEAFFQITGNHDQNLINIKSRSRGLLSALKLEYDSNTIFIFHGHQASFFLERFQALCSFILRYIANPLGIKNYSVSYDSQIRFQTEKRVYNFSRQMQIVSLIGHTHRPLFESLSKVDCLKFKIEQLCRDYPVAAGAAKDRLADKIRTYHQELQLYLESHDQAATRSSLYNSDLLAPCMFNSGCVIGKNGMTALEISAGKIALVYWFNRCKSQKYFNYNGYQPEQLHDTDYFRVVLKQDDLGYIFARIKLLA
ncbi:MAG: metallophosphoesterase family protein [Bacillota bacterium]|jgi:predicted phosphodiesterase